MLHEEPRAQQERCSRGDIECERQVDDVAPDSCDRAGRADAEQKGGITGRIRHRTVCDDPIGLKCPVRPFVGE